MRMKVLRAYQHNGANCVNLCAMPLRNVSLIVAIAKVLVKW